ncbi:MAG TPA: shikimate dehydrogenase [Gammaproteobacteria bacterium]|nr:shikimate dehydrogenase [Gammaproteobacteria bacterium]
MDRYAVMGNPVAHSKSPRIHQLFARQTGQDLDYEALLVPEDGFAEAVAEFFAAGGRGLNVTVPFKQQAWALADRLGERAELAGAVNTLMMREGQLYGDNTDGTGLVRDLVHNHGVALEGRRILLLGAGGAARGVLQPLLAERPARLHIANRTASRAQELAARFGASGTVSASGLAALEGPFDVLIHATAAGLGGEVPPLPEELVGPHTCCYDMMYGDEPTAFARWCRRHGAEKTLDGLGMLVEQAAESFLLWRGLRPETGPVIAALRGDRDTPATR